AITVQIDKDGNITGDTTDIKPGTNVHLVLTGLDKDGNPKTVTKDTTVDANGHYTDVLLPIDGIVDGTVNVVATSTDRNGTPVSDNDTINDLDIFHATINVDINEQGLITGTTEEVAPNTAVHLVISGIDEGGNPITVNKTVQTDANGHYQYQLVPTDGIVDSSAVDVVATTTDISNQPVGPATDSIEAAKDHDNDPETPDQGGLDLVPGAITVDINDSDSTKITGTTTDVAPGSIVTLHITGIDGIGEEIDFYQNVTTDANGHYSYTLTPQQGNALDVVATTSDRNGKPVTANDQFVDTPVVKADGDTNVTNGNNNVVGTSEDDVLAGDIGGLKTNFVAGQDYNVSVVLDLSGSMLWAMNGSSNPPAGESRLEIAKKGLKAFIAQMTGHDGTINLQIASFSASNGVGDGYNQTFMNVSASNVDAIFTYIDNLQAGGGTNPERGFNKAVNWFNGISTSGVENQTYYLTDGEPNSSQSTLDNAFAPLAAQSKVFAVGVSSSIQDSTVSRYDNTDVNGDKLVGTWNGNSNHGTAKAIADADKLIAYLIGGSENFQPADVGNDTVKGGAGGDVLFGDSINTDWITWSGRDSLQYPKYSGYSTLTAYLKAEVTSGAEPTQQQVYDYVKAHFRDFIAADSNDPVTKGGHDTIYGGAGDDIIIAGAGNDKVYGGSGNDIISTGRGDDSIIYDVLKTADATAGNGTDTWVDYETNDKIEFGSNFFNGLLADKSNIADYISVEDDGQGNAVVKVDRDGTGTTHQPSELLIIENQAGLSLQDLLDHNQIVIG
ncbi:type I secretion protein, partial [Acinetobacter higginsii]|uniref:type I secretion protein n=1 Tax=Acinetobacter higginsii TaxID=70347 RepID=UPI0030085850